MNDMLPAVIAPPAPASPPASLPASPPASPMLLLPAPRMALALPPPGPPAVPVPRQPTQIRPATPADLAFIDSLQRMHSKMVGWMPLQQLRAYIMKGNVLVAEDAASREPIGYVMGCDRYYKRDDVGIIYQMNVLPGRQRGLVGAALVKALFARAAYGCRLFCCWCAQDIEANYFWESLGFVPLAFRTGGRSKGEGGKARLHIFWQRRIRAEDAATPYWFPSQTGGGAIREERLVLPIPPGTHWRDAKPTILPGEAAAGRSETANRGMGGGEWASDAERAPPRAKRKGEVIRPGLIHGGGLRFGTRKSAEAARAERRAKAKHDPQLAAAVRELRDRWLERVNAHPESPLLDAGKYDVSRTIAPSALPSDGSIVPAPANLPPRWARKEPPMNADERGLSF